MRVTNGMLTKNYLKNLNTNLKELDKYQTQLSTYKRITKLSDDPIGVLKSMQVKSRIYKIQQYQSTLDTVSTYLADTEASLSDINEILKSAYEKTVQAANDYMTGDNKKSIGAYIGQLKEQLLSIGNSKSGGKYIFGGYNTENAPFTLDVSGNILYNGLDLTDSSNPTLIAENMQNVKYQIGFDTVMDVSMTGSKLMSMGNENIYAILDGLNQRLMNNASSGEIADYIPRLQDAQTYILSLQAEIGGKTARTTLLSNRYAEDIIKLKDIRSKVEDIDVAEATLQYKMTGSVYEAALSIGTSIISPTLVDYLK